MTKPSVHDEAAISKLRAAGRVAAATLAAVGERVAPGVSTAELDRFVREDTARRGAHPSQLGYHGFPAAVCVSVNDVACHGVPRDTERLVAGDIVSVDVTSCLDGYHGDTCATFVVGATTPAGAELIEATRRACEAGIAAVGPGARVGDLGAAMSREARRARCRVVTQVTGHGIGRAMHEAPSVPFEGRRGSGERLEPGMAITIEPILVWGRGRAVRLREEPDGWTLRVVDGSLAAQFEHTVLVTATGHEVLTRPPPADLTRSGGSPRSAPRRSPASPPR